MFKRTALLALSTLFFLCGMHSQGTALDLRHDDFDFKAKVMALDLEEGTVTISEKEIKIPSYAEGQKKIWKTRFLNKNGKEITPDKIQARDRVQVRGRAESGVLTAEEIILLE